MTPRGMRGRMFLTSDAAVVILGVGLAVSVLAAIQGLQAVESNDFGASFYPSGLSWRLHGVPYGTEPRPNMNPPSLTLALFVPASLLAPYASLVVWFLAGAGCLVLSWFRLSARSTASPRALVLGLGMLLCTAGAAGQVWAEGQLTWFLLPVVAFGGDAYLRGRPWLAGCWLGLLVAAKPFFALAAIPLGAAAFVSTGLVALGVTTGVVVVTGLGVWYDWVQAGGRVTWISFAGNASLWGVAARVIGRGFTDRLAPLDLGWAVPGIVAAAIAMWWTTARRRDPDRRWTGALAAAIFLSPLGWSHYLPLLAPGLFNLAIRGKGSRALWIGTAVFLLPITVIDGPAGPATEIVIGSAYTCGLFMLWAAAVGPSSRSPRGSAGLTQAPPAGAP